MAFFSGVAVVFLIIVSMEFYFGRLLEEGNSFVKTSPGFKIQTREYLAKHPPQYGLFPPPPPTIPDSQKYKGPFFPHVYGKKIIIRNEPLDCANRGTYINSCHEIKMVSDGEIIWNINYTLDQFKRRVTPGQENKNVSQFMLILGDSSTFGVGVPDENTRSAYLAKKFPEFKVYNYAMAAAYPGDVLERAQNITDKEFPEKTGVALYFIENHNFERVAGKMDELANWSSFKTVYSEDKNGNIVAGGSYQEEKPFFLMFSKLAMKSKTLRYFRVQIVPDESDLRLAARLIEETKKAVEKKGAKSFFVIIPPTMFSFPAFKLYRYLEELKIHYIDLSQWHRRDFVPGNFFIPLDGHPTGIYNEKLIEYLAPVLRKKLEEENLLR